MSNDTNELIRQGIAAAKNGDRAGAATFLQQATRQDENNQVAWLWLSGCVEGAEQKRACLERIVAIDPTSEIGKQAQAGLEQLPRPAPPAPPARVETTTTPPHKPGSPLPIPVVLSPSGLSLPRSTADILPIIRKGYAEQNKRPGETIILRAPLSPIILLIPAVLVVLGILLLLAGMIVSLFALAGWWLLSLGIALGIRPLFSLLTTEFVLTERRIMAKSGFFFRRFLDLPLNRVESTSIYQPILGRLLNYGEIIVRGMGGTEGHFHALANPVELRNELHRLLQYDERDVV